MVIAFKNLVFDVLSKVISGQFEGDIPGFLMFQAIEHPPKYFFIKLAQLIFDFA